MMHTALTPLGFLDYVAIGAAVAIGVAIVNLIVRKLTQPKQAQ